MQDRSRTTLRSRLQAEPMPKTQGFWADSFLKIDTTSGEKQNRGIKPLQLTDTLLPHGKSSLWHRVLCVMEAYNALLPQAKIPPRNPLRDEELPPIPISSPILPLQFRPPLSLLASSRRSSAANARACLAVPLPLRSSPLFLLLPAPRPCAVGSLPPASATAAFDLGLNGVARRKMVLCGAKEIERLVKLWWFDAKERKRLGEILQVARRRERALAVVVWWSGKGGLMDGVLKIDGVEVALDSGVILENVVGEEDFGWWFVVVR
ncbi:hypothetical protein LR48_Vigan06g113800 [Vigna angularis]|uniref:Uncharacterized protein n=1 Tax=Phaseolus angularis TaxID=3914 RepID=A0A0L9UTB8_PHAAN|nr:hypothetical protein LR48_Vigan06g113800 [Vigna angularis]